MTKHWRAGRKRIKQNQKVRREERGESKGKIEKKAGSQTEAFKSQVWVISRGNKEAKTESNIDRGARD